jgi:hypothetical protein
VGYDPFASVLEIEFHNGAIYHYDDVTANIFSGLMDAPSSGKYFWAEIRESYRATRGEHKDTSKEAYEKAVQQLPDGTLKDNGLKALQGFVDFNVKDALSSAEGVIKVLAASSNISKTQWDAVTNFYNQTDTGNWKK